MLKAFRDLWAGRWQFAAVIVMVGLGVGLYVGALVSYTNLQRSYQRCYQELQFADFWVRCLSAPEEVVREIRRWPGVRRVVGRWVQEVAVDQPRKEVRRLVARVISLPAGKQPVVNQVLVKEGRYLSREGRGEVLMDRAFATTHGYRLGDRVTLESEGVKRPLRIVGIVQSPEYILMVRNKEYLTPAPYIFGVLFVTSQESERLFQHGGSINEICALVEGERRASVMRRAYRRLRPYGAQEPLPREEQPSNRLLNQDLEGFRSIAGAFPVLFLLAAGLTVYSLLMRMVNAQRLQIGFLKASGFSRAQIVWHYLSFAVLIALVGGLVGIGVGLLLASYITGLYVRSLNVPFLELQPEGRVLIQGVLLGLLFTLAGSCFPTWGAARLTPVEAMRERYTSIGRQPWLERLLPVLGRLPYVCRLPFRNLFRSRRRTLSTVVGVASGMALMLASAALLNGVTDVVDFYFGEVMRFDLEVSFIPPESEGILNRIEQIGGVVAAEPSFQVPVELERNGILHSTLLWGLPGRPKLAGMVDRDGQEMTLGRGHLLMTRNLRRKFGVEGGDKIRLTYSFSRPDDPAEAALQVAPRPVRQPMGSLVYTHIDTARAAFSQAMEAPADAVSSVAVRTRPGWATQVGKRLARLERSAGVLSSQRAQDEVHEMLEFSSIFLRVMVSLGCVLTFAIVLTIMNVNVLERLRELATLEALGFSSGWLAAVLTIENLLTTGLGIALGMPLGYGLASYLLGLYSNELVEIELVIFPRTYALAVVSVLAAALVSQIPALRVLFRMNLAKATKEVAG